MHITTKTKENMKYLFITLKVQDGEHEHTHRVLDTCADSKNVLEAADEYAKEYYGKSDKEGDSDWYYFQGGTIAVKVQNVEVLSKFEFDLLSKIFGGVARPGYFQIVQAGYEEGLQREEVEINCGENGKIMIHQDGDKLGFIIDVYGQNDLADTMTVWEEDLYDPDDDDQPRDEHGILTTCPVCDSIITRKDHDNPTTMRNCMSCMSEWNIEDEVTLNGREVK